MFLLGSPKPPVPTAPSGWNTFAIRYCGIPAGLAGSHCGRCGSNGWFHAHIQVPEGFTAVMSATSWEKQKDNTFVFKMSQPIPSYLIALVVGDIVSAEVGPR